MPQSGLSLAKPSSRAGGGCHPWRGIGPLARGVFALAGDAIPGDQHRCRLSLACRISPRASQAASALFLRTIAGSPPRSSSLWDDAGAFEGFYAPLHWICGVQECQLMAQDTEALLRPVVKQGIQHRRYLPVELRPVCFIENACGGRKEALFLPADMIALRRHEGAQHTNVALTGHRRILQDLERYLRDAVQGLGLLAMLGIAPCARFGGTRISPAGA
jgi:hypothetical protein